VTFREFSSNWKELLFQYLVSVGWSVIHVFYILYLSVEGGLSRREALQHT
jgi:hypothetical protein